MKPIILALVAAVAIAALSACGDDDEAATDPTGATHHYDRASSRINPGDFTNVIDNPLFPISAFASQVYEGEETDPDTGETITTRVEITVLPTKRRRSPA